MAKRISHPHAELRSIAALPLLAIFSSAAILMTGCSTMAQDLHVDGTVWQPDAQTSQISGKWNVLGSQDLLVQWTAIDDTSLIEGTSMPEAPYRVDWSRIGQEPWARNVILGLASYSSEIKARAYVGKLIAQSMELTRTPVPLHVVGYYFPVEFDPTWNDASSSARQLIDLPRPLWITVYDQTNIGPVPLADWIAAWLPDDVGVLFQDGCGVYAREPKIARQYLDVLSKRFGKDRIRVIAEAFRPTGPTTFRPATADEIRPQLLAYKGYSVYLFDGPHYVPDSTIKQLAPQAAARDGL
jgi:hypothetical protein